MLLADQILKIGIDEQTQEPHPIKLGFKFGDYYCQFGQVSSKNTINGVARLIHKTGHIMEGQFVDNAVDGWQRWLLPDTGECDIMWCKNGQEHGYFLRLD